MKLCIVVGDNYGDVIGAYSTLALAIEAMARSPNASVHECELDRMPPEREPRDPDYNPFDRPRQVTP